MTTTNYWKDNIDDLRERARSVVIADGTAPPQMTARTAARCLSGVVGLIATRWTVDVMQRACADLARCDVAWASSFGRLPLVNGSVPEPIRLLAVVARGILPIAGVDSMRAALAFWATESDPAVWDRVTA